MSIKNLAVFAIVATLVSIVISGCSPKEQQVVATVGKEAVTLRDYENLYLKGNGNRDSAVASSMQERERFLDLMVNYKLKLADAQSTKLDQKPEIINEVQQYKGGLAASFVTERELTGPALHRLYDRRGEEIRASHILLTLNPKASPEDSAKAYKKAYEIIHAAKTGADFKVLALENSQDPSAKQNGGDLYYFSSGQLVTPFEDAAYSMKPGEMTNTPVRTQFGLHIIKVTDRKPAPGEIRASHIMIRFPNQNPSPQDTAAAYAKIKVVQDSLKQGTDFESLARHNSQDPGSASRGGDLGWFSRRRWVQPFDEAVFQLKPGQVSGIIRTSFGYHLAKVTETKPRKSFEDSKAELQQVYQELSFQQEYRQLMDKLEKQVHVQRNDAAMNALIAGADTNKTVRDSGATAGVALSVLQSRLLSVGPISLTVDSVLSTMKARQDLASTAFRALPFAGAVDKVTEQLVWTVAADSLERRYPEFAAILKDYKEGVLLYQVEQDNVWNRVAGSDSALHVYFDAHRDKFTYPDRVNITEMRLPNETIANAITTQLKDGKTLEEVAEADSARMAAPTRFDGSFKKGATALAPKSGAVLTTVAQQLKADSTLKVQVTVQADTGKAKSKKLAGQRLVAVSAQLRKLGLRPDRIITVTRPVAAATVVASAAGKGMAASSKPSEVDRLELNIVGRQALVLGKIESTILPPDADVRTRCADTLAVGSVSKPIPFRSTYSIVRLNKRESARQKTFEEAGSEVSSTFQEAESKRLETEWLQGLRQRYPVVEHKEVLKDAFAISR
jgi:peptidyl-prolyl cis-trans isomerase SurA